MNKLHTKIGATVELLSPLHIGSGRELLLDYDLVSRGGYTFRVDEDALLAQALVGAEAEGAAAVNRLLAGRPAAELLDKADYADHDSALFRYVMPGFPFTKTAGARIQEQIKDVYDQVYLPGSSLKGALRTLLAWGIYNGEKRKPDLSRMKRSRSWASQPLQQDLFGRTPHYDWLRALHVQDSNPLEPGETLALRTVRVYPTETADSSGLNVDVEVVQQGTVFETVLTIEEYGFTEDAIDQLGWHGKRQWLDGLPALAKDRVRERLLIEAEYYRKHKGPQGAMRFYDRLINTWDKLRKDELILQLGWGAGWESKTLGIGLLRADDDAFERLLYDYRMTKEENRWPGDPFPKSRKLVLTSQGQPSLPMGWVKVRLERSV